jgi:hypothetical protein
MMDRRWAPFPCYHDLAAGVAIRNGKKFSLLLMFLLQIGGVFFFF